MKTMRKDSFWAEKKYESRLHVSSGQKMGRIGGCKLQNKPTAAKKKK